MNELTDDQRVEAYLRELLAVPAPIVTDNRAEAQVAQIKRTLEAQETLRDFWANPEKYNNDCPF